jgi:haloalkane dehalogenase
MLGPPESAPIRSLARVSYIPSFQPDAELYPFRSRWLDTSAGRVHYIDEGEGPTLLFLHGNPTWSFLWRKVIVALRDRFRCVALDDPGFGLSEHPDGYGYTPKEHSEIVAEVMRALDLEDVTIVGHDWGGPIGMRVALDELPRVRGLVMSNTWYWPSEVRRFKLFSRVMSSRFLQRLIVNRNLFVERLLPRGVKNELSGPVMEHYRGPLPSPETREGVAILPSQMMSASFWLGETAHCAPRMLKKLPMLLVWGVQDFAFTPRFMDRFRADFPNVTLHRVDARHYVPEDAPQEFADAVASFLTPGVAAPETPEATTDAAA